MASRQLLPSLTGGVWGWVFCLLLASCTSSPSVPASFAETDDAPAIYPDYVGVTVPANIAPLHFHIDTEADAYVTRLTAGADTWTLGGEDVRPGIKRWQAMKAAALAADGRITAEVFTQHDGAWTRHRPFTIEVSKDSIDPYISYRLISPSYVTYEDLTLNQRCLETFDESLIYGNMINSDEKDGQCINCHHAQGGDPARIQFHVRQHLGGTVIAYDGQLRKVNLKTDSTISAGVYPAWHPTQPWLVYSTNNTGQSFHTRDAQKIEVQDTKSNLIFYDLTTNEVTPITRDTTDLDCFPTWSPDGRYLYYVSAHWERRDTVNLDFELIKNYKDVQYNLYRRPFDERTRTFGPRELVYDAVVRNRSVTLPRVSPDGRYLLFTQGRFGIFHIWHTDADLFLLDLAALNENTAPGDFVTGSLPSAPVARYTENNLPESILAHITNNIERDAAIDSLNEAVGAQHPLPSYIRPVAELNSPDVESWHCWSSNGAWVIFSSRRTDGNFTRPFIAHHDGHGHFSRPFELPQDNPQYHRQFLRSYNIPEFLLGPVTIRPQEFADVIKRDATPATLKTHPQPLP